jgi:methyl-accepting chemotaxis protein
MNSEKFSVRVVAVILTIVTFHILGIELLIFFVMAPSPREFAAMLLYPLPLAITLIITYIIITYYFLKPVLLLFQQIENAIAPDTALIRLAQDRCVNLSYFLSALSFPAYILGGTGGVWIIRQVYPHWPAHILIYGFLAGVIAGLLTIPMSEYGAAWAVRPALGMIMKNSPDFEKARSAGAGIPLRLKFVIILVVMVVGIAGFTAIISYSLVNTGIDNMKRIEALLPAESAALLADDSSGSADTRIRSSAYFKSRMGNLLLFFIGIILIGSLLSLAVAFAAADTITRPLGLFGEVAEKIKNGRFNETINIISNDEFAELGASFNRMTGTLLSHLQQNRKLIKSISDAVDTLNPMSQELVSIADQHASGSIQQAAATENAEEIGRKIADTARQIAENAADIARGSERTQENTREGRQRLTETGVRLEEIAGKMEHIVDSVALLKQQSLEIDDIVEAIKKISGKTNILSLSAGIEAIKAGESGKRFGVVAEEIRHLAQDTGKSAKSIRKNIERIQESVAMSISYARAGEQSVDDGRTAMKQMTAQFEEIARANAAAVRDLETIESMTAEQAETNEKLSRILSTIRITAHDTSASSEQTHSSIKDLKRLINQLKAHTRLHHQ